MAMTQTASNPALDGNSHSKYPASVAVVWSPQASRIHDHLPSNLGRSTLVHTLLSSLGLLSGETHPHLTLIAPAAADPSELLSFHDPKYLHLIGQLARGAPVSDTDLTRAGLVHDSPPFRGLAAHLRLAAGGSIQAATFLTSPPTPLPRIAIHWDGGRHHAQRSAAAGFCYVNDIALAIQHLVAHTDSSLHPVVYLDLDVHHGDGVEAAFRGIPQVVTVSVHHYDPRGGYYPGTGAAEDKEDVDLMFAMPSGENTRERPPKCKNWINVPLDLGCSDSTFTSIIADLISCLHAGGLTHPRAVVIQCGADGLAGDPKGRAWNLSEQAYVRVLETVRQVWGGSSPVFVLGGGGYHHANTARAWAWVTAAAVRLWDPRGDGHVGAEELVPETVPHEDGDEGEGVMEAFGPLFEMRVEVKGGVWDRNVGEGGKVKMAVLRCMERAVDGVLRSCVPVQL